MSFPFLQRDILTSPFPRPNIAIQFLGWLLVLALLGNTIQSWIYVNKTPENRIEIHNAFSQLDFVLPSTHRERIWFFFVAISAGVFEEILFRNFMIRFFESAPILVAAGASAIIFGVTHFYQGKNGVIGTFLFAIIFTVIVAGTQSLFIAMIVHAIWDLRVLVLTLEENHPILKRESIQSE